MSVTVTTYNHEHFIGECLDSILAQEGIPGGIEIVVGVDAGTDRTAEIVRRYAETKPAAIRPLIHRSRIGAIWNFKLVTEAACGDYIAHIDGDDLMRPMKLAKQMQFLDSNPDCAIVAHDMAVFDSASKQRLSTFTTEPFHRRSLDDLVRLGTFFCHSSKMYRRTSIPAEGVCPHTPAIGDWLFHIQNARTGKVGYIREILGDYRKHAASLTNTTPVAAAMRDQLYTLEKAEQYGASPEAVSAARASLHYMWAMQYLRIGDTTSFRRHISASAAERAHISFRHRFYAMLRRFPALAAVVSQIEAALTSP